MRTGTKKIKIVYKPLNTYKNTKILAGSVRQNYDTNNLFFEPDRRIDPLVILVECGVNDPHNYKNGLVNADLTNVVWRISSGGIFIDVLENNREFQIGKGIEKGQLKMFKNISDLENVTVTFTAKYLEPTSKRIASFQDSFVLVTNPIATAATLLNTSAPYGYNLYPTINNQGLICQADLFRGPEKLAAAYYWSKNNVEITDSNGYLNSKTDKLFVPASAISKTGDIIKVEVADCSMYLNQLQDTWVEEQPEVIEFRKLYNENPRNLLNDTYRKVYNENYPTAYYYLDETIPKGTLCYCNFKGILNGSHFALYYNGASNYITAFVQKENSFTAFFSPQLDMLKGAFFSIYPMDRTGYSTIEKLTFRNVLSPLWSPSKTDLQKLINQKKQESETIIKLPINYRPSDKPTILYKGDYLLLKKYPIYEPQLIGPESINPDLTEIEYEIVLNTSDGILKNAPDHFSVGWLKQTNGTFLYKGFKVKIPMAKLLELNSQNKELDYEVFEDLSQKL
ncbi:hypothetical protein [Flavobacterium sp. HSC-61S13]|uniref:hypothetical protein n=1 Tax=Flavobacterium sp. HSC-61S13 TaxID=2910963 RepID=UPI00209D9673|nr:hypothetical protein [Flavobacterium sp. HSC-61S13]MCP1997305.1 hypothetical protein [Flavobacterium sp. HSC-61S13]